MEVKIIYTKLKVVLEFLNKTIWKFPWKCPKIQPPNFTEKEIESHTFLKSVQSLEVTIIVAKIKRECFIEEVGFDLHCRFNKIFGVKRVRERVEKRTGAKMSITAWICLSFQPNQLTLKNHSSVHLKTKLYIFKNI